MVKSEYIFQIKYTKAMLSDSNWKLLCFEISKILIAVLKSKFIVLIIIVFCSLSFRVWEICGVIHSYSVFGSSESSDAAFRCQYCSNWFSF